MKKRTKYVCHASLIAAMYAVLTFLSSLFGLSSGVIQCRISEALCILPVFTPAAIPGLTVGCLIANLASGAIWQDLIFGTLATALGALGTYFLKKYIFLAPIPPILANTLIIPFVLKFAYGFGDALPLFFLTVGIGEIVSAGIFGYILLFSLNPVKDKIFK
ncbi:MAG: QueT transporter family protein [Ruminococcaceae bacterium]|nr:QueT transporter family protein [Oscillospiraceae bacterium]